MSKLVRKYRVLLVRAEGHIWRVRKVLTWRAFGTVMRNSELLEWALNEESPIYINRGIIRKISKKA